MSTNLRNILDGTLEVIMIDIIMLDEITDYIVMSELSGIQWMLERIDFDKDTYDLSSALQHLLSELRKLARRFPNACDEYTRFMNDVNDLDRIMDSV